jgi:hypothetical protein
VPGETPTDLKSLARDDAGRDGVQSRHSEQRAVLGALHRPQPEALAVDLHQIEHSGAGAVGAVVRESDIRAWGTSAGLPSCTVYDNDAAAPRLFLLGSP